MQHDRGCSKKPDGKGKWRASFLDNLVEHCMNDHGREQNVVQLLHALLALGTEPAQGPIVRDYGQYDNKERGNEAGIVCQAKYIVS